METYTLEAETGRVLDLVVHSLYTNREIFLRELISNASDALDRHRFETLLDPSLASEGEHLAIQVEVDAAQRTLTVRDNGIGMNRAEVVANIGTIARSGTKEQIERMKEENQAAAVDLIGRFGVGFYSAFMVADRVTLVTRRANEPHGIRWESSGDVNYTISEVEDAPRGTAVTLHLKPADADEQLEDYTDRWTLSRIVKRYADFVTYPIEYIGPSGEIEADGSEKPRAAAPIVLNSMKPIWLRAQTEVTAEEYAEFYRAISHQWDEPMLRFSFRAEGRWEYAALLFVPPHAPYSLYYQAVPFGLQLYASRMLIVPDCQDLLPRYLRFLHGVVDAADLPLNVSRQSLQESRHLTNIRKWLTKKVIRALSDLRDSDGEKYLAFWRAFGRVFKEGVTEDYENREALLPLLLFESSADPERLTTLREYVARMKPDQKDIYYLTGESRAVIERSPHREEFTARGYEILYLTEPVDEILTQGLPEFEGKRLRSVAKGKVELGDDAAREQASRELKETADAFAPLLDTLLKQLTAHVRAVKVSQRLTVSPACLTGEEFDPSPHIEKLLLRGKGAGPKARRTLELNPKHPIVTALRDLHGSDAADPRIAAGAELLLGYAVVAEGSDLPDPVAFNARLTEVLAKVLDAVEPQP